MTSEDPEMPQRPGRTVRVLVVANVVLYREGVCGSLSARGFEVLGAPVTVPAAGSFIGGRRPDVIVIDAAAPRSFEAVQRLHVELPSAKIVVFGIEDCETDILACAEAGVNGYLLRDGTMDELADVIAGAIRGEVVCPPRVTASLFKRLAVLAEARDLLPGRWVSLTAREREVVRLLDAGLSNKQIATELHIEISTVKNHVHRILEKLHVDSRSAAVACLRTGLAERRIGPPAARPLSN
jgi:DNA-binding NarL/FixJ family response regulator